MAGRRVKLSGVRRMSDLWTAGDTVMGTEPEPIQDKPVRRRRKVRPEDRRRATKRRRG